MMNSSGGESRGEHINESMPFSERFVELSLPEFENEDTPVAVAEIEPIGTIHMDHYNTVIVLHEVESMEGESLYEHMDHVLVVDESQFEEPVYIFPALSRPIADPSESKDMPHESDETFFDMVTALQELNFTTVFVPRKPSAETFRRYEKVLRGNESMGSIIAQIIDESV